MRRYCKKCNDSTMAVMDDLEGVVCSRCGRNYTGIVREEITKNATQVKTMKVWTNGKGICAYKGQDKHNAIKRKESEGYKVMIAKLYDVEKE